MSIIQYKHKNTTDVVFATRFFFASTCLYSWPDVCRYYICIIRKCARLYCVYDVCVCVCTQKTNLTRRSTEKLINLPWKSRPEAATREIRTYYNIVDCVIRSSFRRKRCFFFLFCKRSISRRVCFYYFSVSIYCRIYRLSFTNIQKYCVLNKLLLIFFSIIIIFPR